MTTDALTAGAAAWCVGGRQFGFESPISGSMSPGAHVLLTTPDERRYLGQVVAAELADVGGGRSLSGSGTLLARADGSGWLRAQLGDVFGDARLEIAAP